jgi:hypothetical protein
MAVVVSTYSRKLLLNKKDFRYNDLNFFTGVFDESDCHFD